MSSVPKPFGGLPPVEEVFNSLDQMTWVQEKPTHATGRVANRVKTRFLNFCFSPASPKDQGQETHGPTAAAQCQDEEADTPARLTVVGGPGLGASFSVDRQIVQIGRDPDQDVLLNFGDTAVSRRSHASIACYGWQRAFTIRDGLKPNPVLLNGATLTGERELKNGDLIQIGETLLRFRST